eukprot:152787_1
MEITILNGIFLINTIKQHFNANFQDVFVNLHKTDNKRWKSHAKNNAILALNEIFRYSMDKYITDSPELFRYKKYLFHRICRLKVGNYTINKKPDIPLIIQKYPFLQCYAPKVNPLIATKITTKNLKIGFLNIGGNAVLKLNYHHPYLQNLVIKHKLDLIFLIDTRIKNRPNWSLNGYNLHLHKPPPTFNKIKSNIGGILIYYKSNLVNKITTIKKTNAHDTAWIALQIKDQLKPTYIAINYTRPYNSKLIDRSKIFFDKLKDDILKFKNDCHNLFVIGDFNARMKNYTHDHNSNNHYDYLDKLMEDTGVKIANPKFAPGILTCLAKNKEHKGGSIIDLVLSNKINDIESLNIDTHPCFLDHRPVIFALHNTKCITKAIDKHYTLSSFDPSDEESRLARKLMLKRIPLIERFS